MPLAARFDVDAESVGDSNPAGIVGADEVVDDGVVVRVGLRDVDAEVIAGDDIALGDRGAADQVVVGAVYDLDTREAIAQGGRAGHVGADVIALDDVAAAAVDCDAVAAELVDDQPLNGAARACEG